MKRQEVIEFFGGVRAAARALEMGKSSVSEWGEDVPKSRQAHVRLAMADEQRRRDKQAKKEERGNSGKSLEA